MARHISRCAGTLAGLAISGGALTAQTGASDLSHGEWNQARGDAARTASVLLEPVRVDPEEAWRIELGRLLTRPVGWAGVVFVTSEQRGSRALTAIDARTGETLSRAVLPRGEEAVRLAVWQNTVVAVEDDIVRTFVLRDQRLRKGRSCRGEWTSTPTVAAGRVFVLEEERGLCCLDVANLGVLGSCPAGGCTPAVATLPNGWLIATARVTGLQSRPGWFLQLRTAVLSEPAGNPELERTWSDLVIPIAGRKAVFDDALRGALWLHDGTYGVEAYLSSGYPVRGSPGPSAGGLERAFSPIVTEPAAWEDELYGFDAEGTLIQFHDDGSFHRVVAPEDLPRGARPGPATVASGVLYLGNFAVELEGRGVLWCLPELTASTPLLPLADRVLVYGTDAGQLVGLVEPREPAAAEAEAPRGPVTMPGEGPGLVLADGARLAGAVEELPGGGFRVAPENGEVRELARGEVALVERDDRAALLGEEYAVALAFRAALDRRVVEALGELFESYRRPGLLEDCRRLLAEARAHELDAAAEGRLRERLAGERPSTSANVHRQRERVLREESEARRALYERHLAAASWCAERSLDTAATVLVAWGANVSPDQPETADRAAALVPDSFPWPDDEKAGRRWLRWAEEISPAGARFVPPEELDGPAPAPWDEDTLVLRTADVLLRSREHDPEVVGRALRNAEGAVRTLEELLRPPAGSDRQPLELRLHRDRRGYLEERRPDGRYALPWSAGYYSPAERLTRVYVERDEEEREPLGRELHRMLVHELTHQFLAERWGGEGEQLGPAPDRPGYWIVEGFARFLEDQAVELGRRGRGLDDPTVRSVDAVAQVLEADSLIPLRRLIELTQAEFHTLGGEPELEVRLRNTLVGVRLSERALFYEQAGALVFFLMNRAGPERRAALLEYMRACYERRVERRGWRALGYRTSLLLERDFHEFLREL